nr:hypothetical protein [Streptomyces lavendulae]
MLGRSLGPGDLLEFLRRAGLDPARMLLQPGSAQSTVPAGQMSVPSPNSAGPRRTAHLARTPAV